MLSSSFSAPAVVAILAMSSAVALRGPALRLASPALARRAALARLVPSRASSSTSADAANPHYVPGGPIVRDTVNDALPFPPPSHSHGSYHWAFERLLSAGLVPVTVAAFAVSPSAYPVLDGVLGVALVMHSHIGFDALLVDYIHPRKFPKLGPALTWTLRATTATVLVGVYQFNTNDIGLTELITKVWAA